jgi:hypothetical protein
MPNLQRKEEKALCLKMRKNRQSSLVDVKAGSATT